MKTYKAGLYQARAYRNLNTLFNRLLRVHNLTQSEWLFLGILYDSEKINMTDMARSMGVRHPLATRLSKQLADKGYIDFIKNEKDSRMRYMRMPAAARREVELIESELRIEMKKSLKLIRRSELACYVGVLIKLSSLKGASDELFE